MSNQSLSQDPALNGRYLVRNKWLYRALTLCDWTLAKIMPRAKQPSTAPKRILLANVAHLGDAILTTTILQPLKSAYPDVEIGVLLGSWSKVIFENHPLVNHIHTVDHFFLNRSKKSLFEKIRHYFATRKIALKEIRKVNYDTAVDCRFHFPCSATILAAAKIPVRIGFTSAGFSPLFTHAIDWHSHPDLSIVNYFLQLLAQLPGFVQPASLPSPTLPPIDPTLFAQITQKFQLEKRAYLVCHMGSGNAIKAWPKENWRALIERLANEEVLVFTGVGDNEAADIQATTVGITDKVINLCNKINYRELVAVIANAKACLAVDTSVGHIAAAVHTPTLVMNTGMYPLALWKPAAQEVRAISETVSCAPCYRGRGCETMACLRMLSVEKVYDELLILRN